MQKINFFLVCILFCEMEPPDFLELMEFFTLMFSFYNVGVILPGDKITPSHNQCWQSQTLQPVPQAFCHLIVTVNRF